MAIAKLWSDLISQIPLDLVSSKLILNCLQNCCCKHSWHYPQTVPPKSNPAPKSHSQSRLDPLASSLSPTDEILRANTFPEVTDLFCQLPLPIFFYQPKDALLVIRFHGIRSLRRKENSSQGSCQRLPVQLRYHKSFPKGPEYPRSCSGILTQFLFNKWPMIAHFEMEFPFLLGSTNLSPLRSSKFSFEYLVLPPISAREAVSPRLTPKVSPRPPRPRALQSFAIYSDG